MKIDQLYTRLNDLICLSTILWWILLYGIVKIEQKLVTFFLHQFMKTWHQIKIDQLYAWPKLSLLYLWFCDDESCCKELSKSNKNWSRILLNLVINGWPTQWELTNYEHDRMILLVYLRFVMNIMVWNCQNRIKIGHCFPSFHEEFTNTMKIDQLYAWPMNRSCCMELSKSNKIWSLVLLHLVMKFWPTQ